MNKDVVVLDAPELQTIEESKAKQIKAVFGPMAKMLAAFEEAYTQVIREAEKEITQEVMGKAKRLRLNIRAVRINAEKVRKEQKEEYLRAGNAIDGVSNVLKWAITDKENKLQEIEDRVETQARLKRAALQQERADKLSIYVEDAHERNLADMDEDVWLAYLGTKKQAHEDEMAAEQKAEEDRIAKEKAEAEERERVKIENARLKEEAVAKDKKAKKEREQREKKEREEKAKREKIEAARKLKEEAARKEQERKDKEKQAAHEAELKKECDERKRAEEREKAKRDKKEVEEKAKRAKVERAAREEQERKDKAHEAALRKERDEKERVKTELRAEEEKKRKAEEEETARKEAELRKGDTEKVNDLIDDLEKLKTKYVFESASLGSLYAKDINNALHYAIQKLREAA